MTAIEYFENGCLCVLTHRIAKPEGVTPDEAEAYYMEHCTCTRHPTLDKTQCWDHDKKLRKEALDFIKVKSQA